MEKCSLGEPTVTLDETKYREYLEENLVESAKDLRVVKRLVFQQNNDPKHKASAH